VCSIQGIEVVLMNGRIFFSVELQGKYSIALSSLVCIVFGSTCRGAVYEMFQVTRVNGWQPSSRLAPHSGAN